METTFVAYFLWISTLLWISKPLPVRNLNIFKGCKAHLVWSFSWNINWLDVSNISLLGSIFPSQGHYFTQLASLLVDAAYIQEPPLVIFIHIFYPKLSSLQEFLQFLLSSTWDSHFVSMKSSTNKGEPVLSSDWEICQKKVLDLPDTDKYMFIKYMESRF